MNSFHSWEGFWQHKKLETHRSFYNKSKWLRSEKIINLNIIKKTLIS
ncbi:hypothetical protein DB41_GM00040 [Neochlamydia sp. TUME1]|nr:hypothetical protein DB41_GM00040 [Neochlamydia sp. TUME1]